MTDQTCPIPEARSLAVLAVDVADDGANGQIDSTSARRMAQDIAAASGGQTFDSAGNGVFALYENAVDAVRGALAIQAKLKQAGQPGFLRLRIGVHVGEVLFQGGRPFGETLIVAALLENLCEPGGVLVSSYVKDAAAPRLAATFETCGVRAFSHKQGRIATFGVRTAESAPAPAVTPSAALDETTLGQPPNMAWGAPSPRPKDENACKAVGAPAPLSVDTSDAALDKTILGQPPQVTGAPTQDRRAAAGEGRPKADAPLPAAPLAPGERHGPLTRVLATRIGPIASFIVNRELAAGATPAELIERLAEKIPSPRERAEFLVEAEKLLPLSKP